MNHQDAIRVLIEAAEAIERSSPSAEDAARAESLRQSVRYLRNSLGMIGLQVRGEVS